MAKLNRKTLFGSILGALVGAIVAILLNYWWGDYKSISEVIPLGGMIFGVLFGILYSSARAKAKSSTPPKD